MLTILAAKIQKSSPLTQKTSVTNYISIISKNAWRFLVDSNVQKNQFKEREAYMKYIELFWNRLYYCIFNCDKKTQTLLNRFFECLFYYLKFYRNRKGNNTRIPYNETVGICVSDYIMIGFTGLLIWTLLNLVSILFPCVSLLPLGKTAFILVSVVPCLFINYFFLWRKDKYLRYWEVFAKDTPGIRRVWYCITCVCLLLVWPIFIFSMIIMSD